MTAAPSELTGTLTGDRQVRGKLAPHNGHHIGYRPRAGSRGRNHVRGPNPTGRSRKALREGIFRLKLSQAGGEERGVTGNCGSFIWRTQQWGERAWGLGGEGAGAGKKRMG